MDSERSALVMRYSGARVSEADYHRATCDIAAFVVTSKSTAPLAIMVIATRDAPVGAERFGLAEMTRSLAGRPTYFSFVSEGRPLRSILSAGWLRSKRGSHETGCFSNNEQALAWLKRVAPEAVRTVSTLLARTIYPSKHVSTRASAR